MTTVSSCASLVPTDYPPSFSGHSVFSLDEVLPGYSSFVSLDQGAPEADEALTSLPRYSFVSRPEPSNDTASSALPAVGSTEHQFHLTKKRHNWATLRILSNASSPKQLPKYMAGETVQGTFELILDGPDSIHSISISIKGRIITCPGDGETFFFLDQSLPLWDKTQGDPNSGAQPSFPGKLSGHYTWPFSFPFPTSIPKGGKEPNISPRHQIPQTYLERNAKVSVHYELFVFISRGILRSDSLIQTSVVYVPRIMPEPASALRQAAYLERQLPPCPREDPIGWYVLPSATMHGLVGQRPVEVECTLSLARPLCYTRGAIIPCHLTVRATLPQDLDLLVKPDTIVAHLRRRVRFHQDTAGTMKRHSITPLTVGDVQDLTFGVWWPRHEGLSSQETYQREMHGEIHLPGDLQPSCDFPSLSIEYYIVILPFDSPYFLAERSQVVISQPIRIATVHAPGPTPEPISSQPSSALLNSRLGIPDSDPYGSSVPLYFYIGR
ncbi:hypothetical protein BD779DRAFT_1442937 [Infundibulicybe gibba]|nr:hypothetical protein BD779DRAFT_1442937 [Infundibulicybe gibba]